PAWSCSLRACVYVDPGTSAPYLHKGGAGWMAYTLGAAQARDGSLMSQITGGYKIEYANGAVDTFTTIATNAVGNVFYFLTTRADPAGNINAYAYSTNSGVFRLNTVTNADGGLTHLYYENGSFPNQVTKVVDPYSRTNLLVYNELGLLTNSMDAVGLSSSWTYDTATNVTSMTTPYGTTSFRYGDV